MNAKTTLLLFAILAIGCSKNESAEPAVTGTIHYEVTADIQHTKTSLSANGENNFKLTWNTGDKIGLYIDGRQYNNMLTYSDGVFSGELLTGKPSAENVNYRAYYPYSSEVSQNGSVIRSEIANIQYSPFDGTSDFMYTDAVANAYDERNMPNDMHLTFNHHVFGIVEINVENTDETLANEKILSVTLSSQSATLSGAYSFDLDNPSSAPTFDANKSYKDVTVEYLDSKTLGVNELHKFYAVVNTFSDVNNLVITVKTSSYTFTKSANSTVSISVGEVTIFPTVKISDSDKAKRKKVLSYFGDSIACKSLQTYLQKLLGDEWTVYMNGIPGAGDLHVAALVGCIDLTFQNSFTLPADKDQKVECGNICALENINGAKGLFNVLSTYWFNDHLIVNPITIYTSENAVGIECELLCEWDNNDPNGRSKAKYYLKRVHSSDSPTEIHASSSRVKTYQATHLRDADVMCIYTGTNNSFKETDYASVVNIHKRMRDFMAGPAKDAYIFCGFHTNRYVEKHIMWTKKYADLMYDAFGKHMLDYKMLGLDIDRSHVPVPSDYNANATFSNITATDVEKQNYYREALTLSQEVGAVAESNDFNDADKANVAVFEWPASWWGSYATNVHPNEYGYNAMAIMVYEKMKSLGYLD